MFYYFILILFQVSVYRGFQSGNDQRLKTPLATKQKTPLWKTATGSGRLEGNPLHSREGPTERGRWNLFDTGFVCRHHDSCYFLQTLTSSSSCRMTPRPLAWSRQHSLRFKQIIILIRCCSSGSWKTQHSCMIRDRRLVKK